MDFRIGFGYDSHQFGGNRPFILGGVNIPFDRQIRAHSDGDALVHALCDALLGAASLKDIGTYFPDTSADFDNVDSTLLLKKVMQLVKLKNFTVNNVDVTIVLEKPKLAPYVDSMKQILGAIMKVPDDAFAIKAKTNEKMGFVGRGEGVAVFSVVTLRRD